MCSFPSKGFAKKCDFCEWESTLPAILWAGVSALAGSQIYTTCEPARGPQWATSAHPIGWTSAEVLSENVVLERNHWIQTWISEKVRGHLNVCAGRLSAPMTSSLQVTGWFIHVSQLKTGKKRLFVRLLCKSSNKFIRVTVTQKCSIDLYWYIIYYH